ncbi:MAG: NYN domain-containing protein [Cyanobacteriota bacterium]|nr:NYN domain-containing protein [Cyanobacteriota bacterium]
MHAATTVLLVDGYNMIGSWPPLRKWMRQAPDIARLKLVEMLASYVSFREYQTTVVFDAYAQITPAHQETTPVGIQVYYTPFGETADTYIERTCAQLQWQECRVRVATSDRAQQLVVGGYDAEWLSAQQLWEEIEQTREQIRQLKPKKNSRPERGIHGYLDPQTRERLSRWRLHGSDPV